MNVSPKPHFTTINEQLVNVEDFYLGVSAIKSRKDVVQSDIEEPVEIFQTNSSRKEQLPVDIVRLAGFLIHD